MKRYLVIVQHEVIIYAENEVQADANIRNSPFLKDRTNLRCTCITETPMPENEPTVYFEDYRRAPGT